MKNITFKFILLCQLVFLAGNGISQNGKTEILLDSDSLVAFEKINDTLDQYQVYFTGENHNYKTFNINLQFQILKYLNENQNTNHLLLEQSPGLSFIINAIIRDKKAEHKPFLEGVLLDQFYQLVLRLETYNDSLVADKKIWAHGIDIERFPKFSIYALDLLIKDLDYQSEAGSLFEQIRALASVDTDAAGAESYYAPAQNNLGNFQMGQVNYSSSMSSILDDAEIYRKEVSAILGADSAVFYRIMEGMQQGRKWYLSEKEGNIKSPIIRERYMLDEFKQVYNEFEGAKFYGQFGRCHLNTVQDDDRCYKYYMNSVANRINDFIGASENKVLVMPIYYTNSISYDMGIIKKIGLENLDKKEAAYLIDLKAFPDLDTIQGYNKELPFIIISSYKRSSIETFNWEEPDIDVHLGANLSYYYFNKIRSLNVALADHGLNGFTNKFVAGSISLDVFVRDEQGMHIEYIYIPEVSNNDNMTLRGWIYTMGTSYSTGNNFLLAALGLDLGYGVMKMTETQLNGDPFLIQTDNENQVIYRNDVFSIDPNVRLRLTFPVISINCKFGYLLDGSGKYWKAAKKVEEFSRMSFSAPYIQAGVSLHFRD
mgnify:CR=1 FL=1